MIEYDHEKMTNIRLSGVMSDEDEEALTDAIVSWNSKKQTEIFNKYVGDFKEPEVEEPTEEPVEDGKKKTKQSILVYNQFRKTLKVQMMKEEVLEDHSHTCFMCKHVYPTKDDFKRKHPKTTYPLFIRSLIDVPRYIEVNKILDVQGCLDSPDLRNRTYMLPICLDCKPSRFAK